MALAQAVHISEVVFRIFHQKGHRQVEKKPDGGLEQVNLECEELWAMKGWCLLRRRQSSWSPMGRAYGAGQL